MEKITYLGLAVALAALIVPAFSLAQGAGIMILSPGGGEQWVLGQFHTIKFSSSLPSQFTGHCSNNIRLFDANGKSIGFLPTFPRAGQTELVWDTKTLSNIGCGTSGEKIFIQPGKYKMKLDDGAAGETGKYVAESDYFTITSSATPIIDCPVTNVWCPAGRTYNSLGCPTGCISSTIPIKPISVPSSSACPYTTNLWCQDGYTYNSLGCATGCIQSKTSSGTTSGTVSGSPIITSAPANGQCPENQLLSEDGKECVKLYVPTVTAIAPQVSNKDEAGTGASVSALMPTNGACPENYTVSSDGKECLKPIIVPRIIIAPQEGFKEVDFGTDGKVTIKDNNTNKETKIAPSEGFNTTVSVQSSATNQLMAVKEISIQSNASTSQTTISAGNVSASTNESIQVKENKVFLKQTEVKIMPDTASQNAITKLGDLGFNIELKDTGSAENVKPTYQATATQNVKLFGLFNTKMTVSANVDAQTGTVSELNKPWWSFLAK